LGWLSGWPYRKSHVINPASGAGTGYQIKIIVHYGSGTDSGSDVYLNGKCRTDFGDIRFTASDGVTLLDYWMETYVASGYAVFWVEVTDDLSNNPVTIYIYYGKSDATSISNGDATFLFFDHFEGTSLDPNKWLLDNNPIVTVADSLVRVQGDAVATYRGIKTVSMWHQNVAMRSRSQNAATARALSIGFGSDLAPNAGDSAQLYSYDGGITTDRGFTYNDGVGGTVDVGTRSYNWEIREVLWAPAKVTYRREGIAEAYATTNVPVGTYIPARFTGWAYSDIYADWYLVRKYVDPEPVQDGWGSEESAGLTFSDTVSSTIEDTYSVSVPAPLSFGDTVSPTIEDSYSVSIGVGPTFSDTVSSTIEDSYSIIVLYPEIFRDTISPAIEDSYSIIVLIPKTFRDTIDVTIEDSYSVKTVIMPPPPGASIVIYGLWRLVERMLGMP
jgi:hypothetical protein